MSVYIKGFPLPNNCGACPLRLAWCRERIYMVTRPERCPLVPVPPHGRLIDADALMENEENISFKDEWHMTVTEAFVSVKNIAHAPTIIESTIGQVNSEKAVNEAEEGE